MNLRHVLTRVFERSTDGLLILEDGVFIDCNPTAVALLGCEHKSEIIGHRPIHFSPEYQPDGTLSDVREKELIALALKDGSICFEWMHQRVDGTPIPVEILLIAVEHEGRKILYSNWRDITRRRQTEHALKYRQSLEALITKISSRFINLPTQEIDNGVQQALADLGTFVDADRSYVFGFQDEQMSNLYEWCEEDIAPQIDRLQSIPIRAMAWSNEQIRRGDILSIPAVADLPPAAQAEKDEFTIQGIKSVLVVPMEKRGEVVGFIGFDAVRNQREWPGEVVDLLRIAAGIIANVLDRRDAELQLRETNITLEKKVLERTQELEHRRQVAESLRETLVVVNSNQSLANTLDHLVRQATSLTGAAACTLYGINQEAQTGHIEASVNVFEEDVRQLDFDLGSTSGQELLSIIQQRKPLIFRYDKSRIDTILNDDNVSDAVRKRRAQIYENFNGSISVPLFVRDEPYGALLLYYDEPDALTSQNLEPVMTLAEQAALAIENARLHQSDQKRRAEAEQRRRIAEGLREGLAVLNSNRPLEEILDFVIKQAVRLLSTGGGALYLLNAEGNMLHVGASHGLDPSYMALQIPVGGAITGRAVALGEPVSIPDMHTAKALLEDYLSAPDMPTGWIDGLKWLTSRYNAVLAAPIHTPDTTYGAITLYYPDKQLFTDEVIGLAVAFAGQAALVIENAHLRERVRKTAAVEERNRLARDLHDAVTQTLFSASMIADTLPDLWEMDQEEARQQINRLGQLTRGALAEMRTLLIELRPARLVEADMATLLQQLADAVRGRSKVDITLNIQGVCAPPADVKIALYRIVQEALNNIIKHAQAQHAFVSLRCNDHKITLQVLDDGIGFDMQSIEAGHFGLQIMSERATSIGTTLKIDTYPGEGTNIQVVWRKP